MPGVDADGAAAVGYAHDSESGSRNIHLVKFDGE
jgi:hypothetical protein